MSGKVISYQLSVVSKNGVAEERKNSEALRLAVGILARFRYDLGAEEIAPSELITEN